MDRPSAEKRIMTSYFADKSMVDPRAKIAPDVQIGPFSVIGPNVTVEEGTKIENNVTICGRVHIGKNNHIYSGAVIGGEPQDLSYRGEDTEVVVGDNNIIRELVTISRGTQKDEAVTTIGNDCYLMAACHVAHDCRIGDRVVIANGTLLGGHVHIHDDATLSGAVVIHHFTTVGSFSFIGGQARVSNDVPPYMLVEGSPARVRCVNVVALKRNDFPAETNRALAEAHKLIYRSKVGVDNAREILRSNGSLVPAVNHLISFIQNQQEGRHGRARERRRAA